MDLQRYTDFHRLADTYQTRDRNRRADLGMADILYERLMRQVADFEDTLGADEEVGACLASFGREIQIRVESIGYQNPYFVVFYGRCDATGERVQLVQHTTQLNVLFVAVPKDPLHADAQRIGFHKPEEP